MPRRVPFMPKTAQHNSLVISYIKFIFRTNLSILSQDKELIFILKYKAMEVYENVLDK